MEWNIRRYRSIDKDVWNGFVRNARNATFLFARDYMDYHSDRFQDCSWMAFKGEKLVALLPANIDSSGVLHSHQGLTYGGWILPPSHLDGNDLLEIFQLAIETWRSEGVKGLDYKPVPWIYSSQPSQEDIYALFRLGANVSEINLSSAINLAEPARYNKLRKRALKKSGDLDYTISGIVDSREFMSLVTQCLRERHDTLPVHTAEEIMLLKERFPENIRMFGLTLAESGVLEAGVMIYDTGRVAHAQYIASTPLGRQLNLLTPMFDYLIRERYSDKAYFDFGISNEDHGLYLNAGLLRQKFSYGATGVAYQRWELKI
ncbi:MAG: GNAT family N-acetyltransferase [Muribaculaceae bacterium]|nr:GNAT family N-acetyltransferase [Muribaculaceae bacterium]